MRVWRPCKASAGAETGLYTQTTDGSKQAVCYPGPSNTGQNEECWGTWASTTLIYTDMVDGTHFVNVSADIFDALGNPVMFVMAGQ